jgi:hypothetical protein
MFLRRNRTDAAHLSTASKVIAKLDPGDAGGIGDPGRRWSVATTIVSTSGAGTLVPVHVHTIEVSAVRGLCGAAAFL